MNYPVEKGVPIPAVHSKTNPRYPFLKMEAGDSFFVSHENGHPGKAMKQARMTAYNYGYRVTIRKTRGGFRVWMVGPRERQQAKR